MAREKKKGFLGFGKKKKETSGSSRPQYYGAPVNTPAQPSYRAASSSSQVRTQPKPYQAPSAVQSYRPVGSSSGANYPVASYYPPRTQRQQQPSGQASLPYSQPSSYYPPAIQPKPLWTEEEKWQFFAACETGDLAYIRNLDNRKRIYVHAENNYGNTPLYYACWNGHLDTAKWLVDDKGANVHAENNNGETPLHRACEFGYLAVAKWLVDAKRADVHAVTKSGSTPLHWACRSGNLELVKWLVNTKMANVHAKDNDGNTPLHYACSNSKLNEVQYLLTIGADINAKNNERKTPLHFVCQAYIYRHENPYDLLSNWRMQTGAHPAKVLSIVKWMVTNGADISLRDGYGETPLDKAKAQNNTEVVQFLEQVIAERKEAGRQLSYPAPAATQPYGQASSSGANYPVASYYPPRTQPQPQPYGQVSLPYSQPSSYYPPAIQPKSDWTEEEKKKFFDACEKGDLAYIRNLDNRKRIDVHAQNKDGDTPLHYACLSGNLELVKWLVNDKGANVHVKNNHGETPLYYACYKGHLDTAKWLVNEKGADVHAKDKDGETPLCCACFSGNLELVKWLVNDKGADVHAISNYGYTNLHNACYKGHLDTVKWLVDENGADVHAKNKYGHTPLHIACRKGHLATAKWLVNEKGADVHAKDKDGSTPLDFAKRSIGGKNPELIEFLERVMHQQQQMQLMQRQNSELRTEDYQLLWMQQQEMRAEIDYLRTQGHQVSAHYGQRIQAMEANLSVISRQSEPQQQEYPVANTPMQLVAADMRNIADEAINHALQQQNAELNAALNQMFGRGNQLIQLQRQQQQEIECLRAREGQLSASDMQRLNYLDQSLLQINLQLEPLRKEYVEKQTLQQQQHYLLNNSNQNMRAFYLELRREIHSMLISCVASNRLENRDNFTQTAMGVGNSIAGAAASAMKTAGDVTGSLPFVGTAIAAAAKVTSLAYDNYTSTKRNDAAAVITQSQAMLGGIEVIADNVARLLAFRHEEQIVNLATKTTSTQIRSKEASELAISLGRKIEAALMDGRILSQSRSGADIAGQMAAVTQVFKVKQGNIRGVPTNTEKKLKSSNSEKFTDEGVMRKHGLKWLNDDKSQIHYADPEGSDPQRYGYCWAFGHQLQGMTAKYYDSAANLDPAVAGVASTLKEVNYIDPKVHNRAMRSRPEMERAPRTQEQSMSVYGMTQDNPNYNVQFPGVYEQLLQRTQDAERKLEEERRERVQMQQRMQQEVQQEVQRQMRTFMPQQQPSDSQPSLSYQPPALYNSQPSGSWSETVGSSSGSAGYANAVSRNSGQAMARGGFRYDMQPQNQQYGRS